MLLKQFALIITLFFVVGECAYASDTTAYVRYKEGGKISYGEVEKKVIYELSGNIFDSPKRTGKKIKIDRVEILAPTDPQKVLAVGHNFKSHIGNQKPPSEPVLFAKLPTSVIAHNGNIRYLPGTTNLHYEGEMVLIIGKQARNVAVDKANQYIFAVAPGNDVSERIWQQNDVQWFRGKASDSYGPVGPVMVSGVDYDNLLIQTRVNGKTKQSQSTKDMFFSTAELVSYISRYVTLEPGDLIFTGTPGTTSEIKPGDVVEVELGGVGVLRNTVGAVETY